MRVSYAWLKELVELPYTPAELAEVLTRQGLTVDAFEHWGGPYEKIVVGAVKEVRKHPQADALWVCQVDVGREVLQIVCGAANVRVGLRVPVALPGARVGGMTIKRTQVRGVESYGMCCAADELGISGDHSGIMELDESLMPGTPLEHVVAGEDYIYELDIANNRPDLLSHVGIAREIWAHLRSREGRAEKYEPPAISLKEEGAPIADALRVHVEDLHLCPRYLARVIEGVTIKPSPIWMQARLYRLGMRPINNVVDVTNYVLLEYGHPLHAFDGEKLVGCEIIVRRARQGERLKTLDGVERELDEGMIVIADAERSVALAGVMGGENTEVGAGTRAVVLESAYFDAATIRRAAKRLGIMTEASRRFERGVRGTLEAASARAAELMGRYAGGRVRRGVIDVRKEEQTRVVRVSLARCEGLLGMQLDTSAVRATLSALGFECEDTRAEWEITVPAYRVDVAEYADIAEELARVYGYDKVPVDTQVGYRSGEGPGGTYACRAAVRAALTSEGLYEAYNPSLVSIELLKRAGVSVGDGGDRPIVVANATTQEQSVLRTELYPGLLRTIQHNRAQGAKSVRLFEVGRVYRRVEGEEERFEERERCALVLWGLAEEQGIWGRERLVDMFDVKGVVERLLRGVGVREVRYRAVTRAGWHPGRTAQIEEVGTGRLLGWVGELHPLIVRAWDLTSGVAVAELDLEAMAEVRVVAKRFERLPRFPVATRDVAFVVPEQTTHDDVMNVIRRCGVPLLREASLFDLYRGGQIPPGHVSMAYHIVYRSDERTLTDEEVDAAHSRLVAMLEKELGAQVRA